MADVNGRLVNSLGFALAEYVEAVEVRPISMALNPLAAKKLNIN